MAKNVTPDPATIERQNKIAGARMKHGRLEKALLVARVRKGTCLADGADPAETAKARAAVAAAEQELLDCELLIETLQGRHAEAVVQSREQAQLRLEEDAQEILTQLGAVGVEVDAAMAALGELVNTRLIPMLDAARLLPNATTPMLSQLTSAAMEFKIRLLASVGKMPGCGTGENLLLRKQPWSASLPQPGAPPKKAA